MLFYFDILASSDRFSVKCVWHELLIISETMEQMNYPFKRKTLQPVVF